ncbi:glycosyltransferase family 9 protein [Patescibacteria group bacterium]|nr:glycosyltransferase family 9 protein [Patescibacteria group bacterium]
MFRSLILALATLCALPWLLIVSKLRSKKNKKALVIQLGKIGDLVCTTPLFKSLSEGGYEVSILCLKRASSVLDNNPNISTLIFIDDDAYKGLSGRFRLFKKLYSSRFALSITVLPGFLTALLGLWTAAPVRLHTRGGKIRLMGLFFHLFHSKRIKYERGTRTFDHYMKIAEMVGAPEVEYKHDVYLTGLEKTKASGLLESIGVHGRFAVLSLTAGNPLKEWPLENFVELARYIHDKYEMKILFSSADKEITAKAHEMFGREGSRDIGGINLRELSAIIAKASLFVSVDTGPLYIAHALGVALVDIVGCVDPGEQPPKESDKVRLVLPPDECNPSSFVAETLRVSNEEQRRALDGTTVEMVEDAVDNYHSPKYLYPPSSISFLSKTDFKS